MKILIWADAQRVRDLRAGRRSSLVWWVGNSSIGLVSVDPTDTIYVVAADHSRAVTCTPRRAITAPLVDVGERLVQRGEYPDLKSFAARWAEIREANIARGCAPGPAWAENPNVTLLLVGDVRPAVVRNGELSVMSGSSV